MKRVLITIALAVVGVGVGVTAAQAEVVVNDKQTMPFAIFVPCANGGAGEVVSGTIDQHNVISFTINDNNVSGKFHSQAQGGDLTGETTGDKYQATGGGQFRFNDSLQNDQFNQAFVINFRIIGPGPGNNFLVHQNGHVTINANGDVTVVHSSFSIDCK